MDIQRHQLLGVLAGATAIPSATRFACAEDYPSRVITFIVGFAAGGPTDVNARVLADQGRR